MSDTPAYTRRRPRMDPDAHRRILAEVARVGRLDASEITDATKNLRDGLLQPIEDAPEAVDLPMQAAPAAPESAAEMSLPPAAHQDAVGDLPAPAVAARPDVWPSLASIAVKGKVLDRNLVITANRTDPAYASFDVLRTRLVQALREKGWKRVAITSPTSGCGKSFTATNLAMTLSRYENCRTVLLDMDLRRPSLARYLGQSKAGSMGAMLRGDVSMADHLKRMSAEGANIGDNLAVGLNDTPESYASELFQQPKTTEVLDQIEADLNPDVILYDLPPALAQDDVISFRQHFDCVLLVVGGGLTTAKEVKEVNRRMGEDKPVLGVVLNMAEDKSDNTYVY